MDTFKGTKDELDLLIQNLSVGSYGLLHNMDVQPPKSGEWLIRFKTENGVRGSKIFVYPNRFHFVGISPLIESKVAERLMGAVKFFTEGFQETLIVEKVNQTDSGVLQFESAFTDNHPITDYLKKLDLTLKFYVYLLDNKRVIMTDELPLEYDPLFIDVLKWITYPMTLETRRFGLEFKRFMDYKMPQATDQLLWKISLRERETDLCFYGNTPFTRKRYNEKVLYRALAPVEVEQGLGIYYEGFFPIEFNVFPGSYSELSERLKAGYYAIRLSTTTKTHVLNYKTDKGIVHQFLPSIDEASVRNLLQTLKSSFE